MGRRRFTTVENVERIAQAALLGGYGRIIRHRHVHLDLEMDCVQPYGFTLHGRYSASHGKRVQPITVTAQSRCRKCEPCKHRRSMFWTGRAITEYQQSTRTLFGTFTMSIDNHMHIDYLATVRLRKLRVDFGKLSPSEIFTERSRQFGFELQEYLKRLRKGNAEHVKPAVRYLLIAEMHDSAQTSVELRGRPHFHILLHEQQGRSALVNGDPVEAILNGSSGEYEMRKVKTRTGWQPCAFASDESFIRKQWTLGYTKFQWAHSTNSAVYICKYLTKALAVRVRASQRYGLRDFSEISQTQTPKGQAPLVNGSVNDDPQEGRKDDLPQRSEGAGGVSAEPR